MKLQRVTWTLMEISAILLFIILIGYGYIFRLGWLGWDLCAAILLVRVFEMKTALAIGREHGLTERRIICKTLVLGFTWWLPLRRGVFQK